MKATVASRRTGPGAGAVAVIEIRGDVDRALAICTPPTPCPTGGIRLAQVPGIDECLLARPSDDRLLLMPHGGEAIVRSMEERLQEAGVTCQEDPPFSTAANNCESAMLAALPRARTPLALDLVLEQPARWKAFDGLWTQEDETRSRRLDRLLSPPCIVLAGGPNIGKSTLLNTLAGVTSALVDDAPGTTRDHVGKGIDLAGLLVEWIDTPGLRTTGDPIEAAAIDLALDKLEQADLVVAAADATSDWPDLTRQPHLRLGLRWDLGHTPGADLCCSSIEPDTLEPLVRTLRGALLPDADLANPRPWLLPGLSPP